MRKPHRGHLVVGHPIVAFSVVALTGFAIYKWYKQEAPTLAVVAMIIVICVVGRSYQVAQSYQEKLREWQAVTGAQPAGTYTWRQIKNFLIGPAILLWCGGVYLSWLWWSRPDMKLPIWGFIAASAIGFLVTIWRDLPRKQRRPKETPVMHCLTTARQSPSVKQATKALPAAYASLLTPPSR